MAKNRRIPKGPVGAPCKLTDELADELCTMLEGGNYPQTACAAMGINPSTFHRWLVDGARAKSGKKRRFCDAVKKAIAKGQVTLLSGVKAHVKGNWQAGMTILERRWPDQWARKDFLSVQGQIKHLPALPDEVLRELTAQAIARINDTGDFAALDSPAVPLLPVPPEQ